MRPARLRVPLAFATAAALGYGCPSLPSPPPTKDVAATEPETTVADAADDGATAGDAADSIDIVAIGQDVSSDTLEDATELDVPPDSSYPDPNAPWANKLKLNYYGTLRLVVTRTKPGDSVALPACSSTTTSLQELDHICWRESCGATPTWAKYEQKSDEGPETVALLKLDPDDRYWIWIYAPDGSPEFKKFGSAFVLNHYWLGMLVFQMTCDCYDEPRPFEKGSIHLVGLLKLNGSPLDVPIIQSCLPDDSPAPCAVGQLGQLHVSDPSCHSACVAPLPTLPGALTPVACPVVP